MHNGALRDINVDTIFVYSMSLHNNTNTLENVTISDRGSMILNSKISTNMNKKSVFSSYTQMYGRNVSTCTVMTKWESKRRVIFLPVISIENNYPV